MTTIALLAATATILVAGGAYLYWQTKPKQRPAELPEIDFLMAGLEGLPQELMQRAQEDYQTLADLLPKIEDATLREEISYLQNISRRILSYLSTHVDRVPQAQKFIDYYQDRAARLASEYCELERTGLNTPEVAATKEKIKAAFHSFSAAYEGEFEKLLSNRLMDVDAELNVIEQSMTLDGITPKKPEAPPLNFSGDVPEDDIRPASGLGRKFTPKRLMQSFAPKLPQEFRNGLPIQMSDHLRPAVVREKMILAALAFFLGGIGAHKFYRGRSIVGILYLLFCWTGIPLFISTIESIRYAFMPVESFYRGYYKPDKERLL